MNLKVNYNADDKTRSLEMDLDIDISRDAEALGYINMVLFECCTVLARLCKESNPVFHERINRGIRVCIQEKQQENNINYPFTKFMQKDE